MTVISMCFGKSVDFYVANAPKMQLFRFSIEGQLRRFSAAQRKSWAFAKHARNQDPPAVPGNVFMPMWLSVMEDAADSDGNADDEAELIEPAGSRDKDESARLSVAIVQFWSSPSLSPSLVQSRQLSSCLSSASEYCAVIITLTL